MANIIPTMTAIQGSNRTIKGKSNSSIALNTNTVGLPLKETKACCASNSAILLHLSSTVAEFFSSFLTEQKEK
jgi:hypothetical protein